MPFDFKKELKDFYSAKSTPKIVTVPRANFIAVRGNGNPNDQDGSYQQAVKILFAVAYTLKMSYKTDYKIDNFFEYVVPPLEGLWWTDDISNKDRFNWISMLRLPDFITEENFNWAKSFAENKKQIDCSSAEFFTFDEGLCVQILHVGSFDNESETIKIMNEFVEKNNYVLDLNENRLHHEIYLSDARKVEPEKLKTIIRQPIQICSKR